MKNTLTPSVNGSRQRTLENTIQHLLRAGHLCDSSDVLGFLLQQGYHIDKCERFSITVTHPDGETYRLEGWAFSRYNSRIHEQFQRLMVFIFYLMLASACVARIVWEALFTNFTTVSREGFWEQLSEPAQIAINLWGYNIPLMFLSIAIGAVVAALFSVICRYFPVLLWRLCKQLHQYQGRGGK